MADGSADLLGKGEIQQSSSAELLSNFRVSCCRCFGHNWQRKMWFDGTYYWRGRYCPTDDALKFEYIAAAGLAGNVWTENAAARIDASGFTGIDADFTVRGGESGIPTTIHYSDGTDTHVAESDGASLTGWAWQNLTKVFDGTPDDWYRRVNLCANRTTPTPRLWAVAVFYDDLPDGKQWVKASRQSTGGDITGWDGPVDISNTANTSEIFGCSARSMGDAGPLKNDIMVVYKEGIALRSRYYDGAWQAIQAIDTTTLAGKAYWDFEHGEVAGEDEGHIIYVDADESVRWRERDPGAAEVWSASEQLHAAIHPHYGVGIVEHGSGWLWLIWVNNIVVEYRLHLCATEIWFPPLANPPLLFDTTTEAVIDTSTIEQPNTPDRVPAGKAVPMVWVGKTAPETPCAIGWGLLREAAERDLPGNFIARQLTSTDLYAHLEVGQDSADLLGNAKIRHIGTPIELFGKGIVKNIGSVGLLGKCVVRHIGTPVELLGKDIVRHVGAPEALLGEFVVRHFFTLNPLGKFTVRHTATPVELLGRCIIRHVGTPVELLGRSVIRHETHVELLGRSVIRHSDSEELLGRFIVRHTGIPRELFGKCVVRHTGIPQEILSRSIIRQTTSRDLGCTLVVRHSTHLDLPAIFWVRLPSRLWTNRRYINGVIELDEKLLGDAALEYVIEGVMEDVQGYLDNADLPYSQWTNITLVPVQILRAVTYGTVASLYARHTQTFRSRVIPSITPVTVTIIGDAEKAMNYWEDRMNEMLEFYVTSQGGDVMLTSTDDEEPIFSMEDIPEEITEYVSWRVWLQRRAN